MKENLGAAKLPDSNPVIVPRPLPLGGSVKTASLPRQRKFSRRNDRFRAVFLFSESASAQTEWKRFAIMLGAEELPLQTTVDFRVVPGLAGC
jgi:hypothetical protein